MVVAEHRNQKEETREFQWDVETFVRASRLGLFEDPDRYELLDGQLILMPAEQPHSIVSTLFFEALTLVFGQEWLVWTERPLRLHRKTRPVPDVVLVPGPRDRWFKQMPKVRDARLIVEVSASTLSDDLGRKADIYALEGVPEYWVVDVYGDRLIVMTDPRDGIYRTKREFHREDLVPHLEKPLGDLIPVRYSHEDSIEED